MKRIIPILQALAAAVLFGLSAPFSKLLLKDVTPVIMAGLLYLGSGMGAAAVYLLRSLVMKASRQSGDQEARLQRKDLPWLAGSVLAGGVIGPVLLLIGLQKTAASSASLLLNFETVATTLIAVIVFREAVDRRMWWSMALIVSAGLLLSVDMNGQWGLSLGALLVAAACLMWGIDNNLTRQISQKDPVMIVLLKGVVAGLFSLLLGFLLTPGLRPGWLTVFYALLLGSLSYGASIGLFIRALRGLGAARTGMLFAAAPFAGAALSFLILREPVTIQFLIALPLMVVGVILLILEKHAHEHSHDTVEHEHQHEHSDPHHEHPHPYEPLAEVLASAHSHPHRHVPLDHSHSHAPDVHHRHGHDGP